MEAEMEIQLAAYTESITSALDIHTYITFTYFRLMIDVVHSGKVR